MTDKGLDSQEQAAPYLPAPPTNTTVTLASPGYGEPRRGLVSLLLGMGSYYGARHLGAGAVDALLISTGMSGLRVGYTALRIRRLEPVAAFLLSADGITLIAGLLAQSPVVTMFGQHIPGIVFGIFLIVSLIRNRPATELLVDWFRPGWVRHHIANHMWTDNDARAYHRTHVGLTFAVTTAHLLHLIAAAAVILMLPVDIAKGVLGILALTADAIALVIVFGGVASFLRRRRRQ